MQHATPTATAQKHILSRWQRHLIGSCCILFLFFLSSSNSMAARPTIQLPPPPVTVYRLQIQLQTPHPGPVITVNDISIVSRLYNKMYQLPPYRPCVNIRQGDVYSLTFYHVNRFSTQVSVVRNGCGGLTLSRRDIREPDQIFWNLFDQAVYSGSRHTPIHR